MANKHSKLPALSAQQVNRFWKFVNRSENHRCWDWLKPYRGHRYGLFHAGQGKYIASRIAYYIQHFQDPEDLCVLHTCDNPLCCNPNHLHLGTQADNARDRELRNRGNHATGTRSARYTHPETTARGSSHGRSRLTEEDVLLIRQYLSQGVAGTELAKIYGVTPSQVGHIKHYRSWKHI